MTAQRDSFQMRVVQMRTHTLTAEVQEQHQRTHDQVSTLTDQLTAAQARLRTLEADLASANIALCWPPNK